MAFTNFPALTIVEANHLATLDRKIIARQGEAGVPMSVTFPVAFYTSGLSGYIDYIRPDGESYYDGPFDISTGTFTAYLGGVNNVLELAGLLRIQFVIRNVALSVIWKSTIVNCEIAQSADAVDYVIPSSMPAVTPPDTYAASKVTLQDSGNRVLATELEAAIQEITGAGRTTESLKSLADLITSLQTYQNYLWNLSDGWFPETLETAVYVSANSFKMPGNFVTDYLPGTKLKIVQTTTKYFYVVSASYASSETTIVVTAGSDYALANEAIGALWYSFAQLPKGFPVWFIYTTTTTGWAASGLSKKARFKIDGRTCVVKFEITGTSDDTVSTLTTPIAAAAAIDGESYSYEGALGASYDGGSLQTTAARCLVTPTEALVRCYKNMGGTAWTNTGTKAVRGTVQYPI